MSARFEDINKELDHMTIEVNSGKLYVMVSEAGQCSTIELELSTSIPLALAVLKESRAERGEECTTPSDSHALYAMTNLRNSVLEKEREASE